MFLRTAVRIIRYRWAFIQALLDSTRFGGRDGNAKSFAAGERVEDSEQRGMHSSVRGEKFVVFDKRMKVLE